MKPTCCWCITASSGARRGPSAAASGVSCAATSSPRLNLYAAHLALDAHPEVGNNAELARRLGLEVEDWFMPVNGVKIGVIAGDPHGIKLDYLVDRFEQHVGPVRLVQGHGPRIVHRVGIVSGFGAKEVEAAAALGCDTFLTGETSHAEYYAALGAGVNLIYGGHYTTETVGVQALGGAPGAAVRRRIRIRRSADRVVRLS